MDPEGVYEFLSVEIADIGGHYGVSRTVKTLPFVTRLRKSLFRSKNLPLTYTLPKRIGRDFQGRVGLFAYDIIFLLGVDVHVFTPKEMLNILSYVEHGGSLVIMGGGACFGKGDGSYAPWESVLPVKIPVRPEVRVNDYPKIVRPHFITNGIPDRFGMVKNVNPVETKNRGESLMEVKGHPLLIASETGNGKVIVIPSWPEVASDYNDFFAGDSYADVLRQAIIWSLIKEDKAGLPEWSSGFAGNKFLKVPQIRIKEFVPAKEKIYIGEEVKPVLKMSSDDAGEVKFCLLKSDAIVESIEREPQFTRVVGEEIVKVHKGHDVSAEYSRKFENGNREAGRYRLIAYVKNEKDEAYVQMRQNTFIVEKKTGFKVRFSSRRYFFSPGMNAVLRFEPVGGLNVKEGKYCIRGRVVDDADKVVFEFNTVFVGSVHEYSFKIPELRKGEYRIYCDLLYKDSGETVDEALQAFYVVDDYPEKEHPITFVGPGAGIGCDEERSREEIDDIKSHGFNAVMAGSVGSYDPEKDVNMQNWDNYICLMALNYGMDIWGEYETVTNIPTRGERLPEGAIAPKPCVFSTKDYVKSLEEFQRKKFINAEFIPRLRSYEILDEPHMTKACVCHCEMCRDRYREKYGTELPEWEDVRKPGGDDRLRYRYYENICDYYEEGFRQTYNVAKSFKSKTKIHHVFCGIGCGQYSSNYCVTDNMKWLPYCDSIEFDCYNYMYAHYRCAEQFKFHQFHYFFGVFRTFARIFKKRLGFFIQFDDRDYPHDIEPIRAPVEIIYSALGAGAKDFHTMAKALFSNVFGLREERFHLIGRELTRIQKAIPVLSRTVKPVAKMCMIFPFSHYILEPPEFLLPENHRGLGFYRKEYRPFDKYWPQGYIAYNSYELLFRAFGEIDVLDERMINGEISGYRACALFDTKYLERKSAEGLIEFVKNGGVLFCDGIPSKDSYGNPLEILNEMFGEEEKVLYQDFTVRRHRFGKGETVLFSKKLQDYYSEAVESENIVVRKILKETIRDILFSHNVYPDVLSLNPQIEADILHGEGFFCVIAINHSDNEESSEILIYNPLVHPKKIYDLITMEEIGFEKHVHGIIVQLKLGEREGKIMGFYGMIPENQEIEFNKETFKPGDVLSYRVLLKDKTSAICDGSHDIRVQFIDPNGKERERYGTSFSTLNGIYEKEAIIALNEIPGAWQVLLTDRFTMKITKKEFTIGDGS